MAAKFDEPCLVGMQLQAKLRESFAEFREESLGLLSMLEPNDEVISKTHDVICVRGNHERWALERRRRRKDVRSFFEPCNIADYVGGGIDLSREALAWLATLHTHWEAELEGVRVAMWHARPGSDMEGIEKERTGPELRRRLLEQAHADVLIVGHVHVEVELAVDVPPGKILNPGSCCSKSYVFKQAGPLIVPDEFRPATFGVLELPSMGFEVFRALDGERVFGTSPDTSRSRRPKKSG